MYRLHKIVTILTLLISGAFLHKGISQGTYGDVAYGLVYVFLAYVNPIIWNNDDR